MIRNLTPDDLEHLRYVIALLRSEKREELADRLLSFTEARSTRVGRFVDRGKKGGDFTVTVDMKQHIDGRFEVLHVEVGTPSQVIDTWDRLAREDERPS